MPSFWPISFWRARARFSIWWIRRTERWLKWPFSIPPLPVQFKIVEVLNAARREVALFEAQIEKLKQEKAALMAQPLTGKRRVRLDPDGG